jgi:hypothetical protein
VPPPLDSDRFSLRPGDARRAFARGSELSFSYEIYNPGTSVETASTLWRDTARVAVLRGETLTAPPGGGTLIATGTSRLAADLPAGTYVLQLTATSDTPAQPKRPRSAVQRISFDVK